MKKKLLIFILVFILALTVTVLPATAKTTSSAKADNVFFYAENAAGESVLLKVMPLSELKTLAHAQANGDNYYISSTDNYPTTQYCEGVGFTVGELLDYVKSKTTVTGAAALGFAGEDSIALMATDSYGNYSRYWTYAELYGEPRYFFAGIYDVKSGWNSGWEVAGEDNSKFGLSLDEYNADYASGDPYFDNKRAVFKGGVQTTVVLMTESYSGRTSSETLVASTEPGIASYIKANGGRVAGSLADVISDEYALRLSLPMTEADLMAAHRTAYDNFKWIYNIKLQMAAPALASQGTVAEPIPTFSRSGNTVTVSFSCATAGATIYYGDDGAPQTLYRAPFTVDVSGRDLDASPLTIYATAVREGWADAGVLSFKYPGMAPAFQTVYSSMAGNDLVFTAADGVSAADWTAWCNALNFITMKSPAAGGYATLSKSSYTVDHTAKTVTFNKSLFADTGSYNFIFHATKYADKSASVTMKKAAPSISVAQSFSLGEAVTLSFGDSGYQSGLSIYVMAVDGTRTMISASYLDRTQAGLVQIKPEYFSLTSSAMKSAGQYTLALQNNSYSPASQTVSVVLTAGFTDVPADAWFYTYVSELAKAGVVNGVSGGRFDPQGTLTWCQALKLLMLSTGYEEQAATTSHWASGYMQLAQADGLIAAGVEPDAPLSRLEFCQTAAKAMKATTTLTESPFTDTSDSGVLALNELGIIDGMGGGLFSPNTTLTRAQISKIIWCIMELNEANETEEEV